MMYNGVYDVGLAVRVRCGTSYGNPTDNHM